AIKKLNTVKNEIEKGKLSKLYIFVGDERRIIDTYIKRISENYQTVSNYGQMITNLRNKGLFNQSGCYVLNNNKEITEQDFKAFEASIKNDIVILTYDEMDKRKKFFKDADKYITTVNKLNDMDVMKYIKDELNRDIPEMLVYAIAMACGNDLYRIDNELNKLRYIDEIDINVLSDLITPIPDDEIFKMIDSIAKKESDNAMEIYYDLLYMGESEIKIIHLLYMKYKQLLLVGSYINENNNEIMNKTGLTYYQVKNTRNMLQRFMTPKNMLSNLRKIHETEINIKTGKEDIKLSTENLLLELMK